MGHLARLLEEGGTATVVIGVAAFRDRLAAMGLPRVVVTPHLMGRPLGAPWQQARQQEVLLAAFDLLAHAQQGKTIIDLA